MNLKKPADPADIENHRITKELLKALKHKRIISRRWHYHCLAAIDGLWQVLMDDLARASLAERPAIICRWEREMDIYLKPPPVPGYDTRATA